MKIVEQLKQDYKCGLKLAKESLDKQYKFGKKNVKEFVNSDVFLLQKWAYRVPRGWYGFSLGDIPFIWVQIIDDFLKYIDIFEYPIGYTSFDKTGHKTIWGGFISLIFYMAVSVIFALHIIGF